MISRIIKVSVRVISLTLRLRLITLTSTLITLDITKTSSNNCLIAHSYEWKWRWRWPCFDTNLPALLCKSTCSYANYYFSKTISITKQRNPIQPWSTCRKMVYNICSKSKKLITSRSIKTRASLAWAYLYHDSNPYIKKPYERTSNYTLPQKLENHCITSSSYWIIVLNCYCPSSNSLFGHEACAFILVPGFLALQHMNICVDRGKFRTYFALL